MCVCVIFRSIIKCVVSMHDFVYKSKLFKEVNNSHLDEMNSNLWRKALLDANFSSNSNTNSPEQSSGERIWFNNEENKHLNDINSGTAYLVTYTTEDEEKDGGQETATTSPSSLVCNSSPFCGSLTVRSSSSNYSPTSANCINSINMLSSQLCILHLDMTYEDRFFFGLHNFAQLKRLLFETQCDVDFYTSDNKVSITGYVQNVQKMCEMFISHLTLSMQIEFRFFDEKYLEYLRNSFSVFHSQCEMNHKVYVTYQCSKSSTIVFTFTSFRNNSIGMMRAMIQLKNELSYCKIAVLLPDITTSMRIPANRRDLTGRANAYIDQIQKQTQTKIEITKAEDNSVFPFENVVITGKSIFSVIQARFELILRFNYELKFQIVILEKRPLVEYISKLSHELRSIFISIEPTNFGSNTKVITISGTEKNIGKLFIIREKLIEQVKKCNGSMVQRLF